MNKKIRSILLSAGLAVGLTFSFPTTADAATYTVVKGDSLYFISQIFLTSVDDLMRDNNLYNYDLNIGQILNVPSHTHTVQKGDTLYLISQKYNISLSSLRRANNIYTNYIDIGQVLNIPTKASLPAVETEKTEPWQSYSAAELDLLARLIMAETESQPYQAKVAVGAVVLNRIKSGVFAGTITEVINQKFGEYYQFTPVENGWIKRPANEECIRAAKEALNEVDPTNGALFYYDDSTTNTWILSKPVSIKIGRMIYSY
ncbi:LysM peptidoglycan-binding domain-containing protein [Sedimentibacter sp.]|uniref:LysM peptidoglycan-binding domain-containing protein n=1 Tax=Sedimentibacter sp. TaxID=1960295 RepID=UPI0028AC25A9|nr:LysM peptidoglycan-binding domain-containing protein [Sedimentibacter sp.]